MSYRLALEYVVEIHVPRYQPRSTLALTLHSFAVEEGKDRVCRGAAHRAFFVEGLDVSDQSVLRETAPEAGLDADAAMEAVWDLARNFGLRSVREEALRLEVHGVPTVTIGTDMLYYGAADPAACAPCWPGGRTPARFEGDTRNVYTQESLQVRQRRRGRPRSAAAPPRLGTLAAVRSEERR